MPLSLDWPDHLQPNIEGKGVCCNELDIWEANSRGTHLAPHTCNQTALYLCQGDECGIDGVCDEIGCGYNPYRFGRKDFYGRGLTVDTTRPFTVITQFPANAAGKLVEIRRLYIQDGKLIQNAPVNLDAPEANFMDDKHCVATGAKKYMELGGNIGMGESMTRGMVLAMSIWWDEGGAMNWLDSEEAGPCTAADGYPADIRVAEKDPAVIFSNIKWGEIDSTYKAS
jgi:cellulase